MCSADKDVIDMALIQLAPLPVAPGISAGSEVRAAWWTRNMTGLFRVAWDASSPCSFIPLFNLSGVVVGRHWDFERATAVSVLARVA
jgi:hypothetical protein